jgi:hypothetical protein
MTVHAEIRNKTLEIRAGFVNSQAVELMAYC